MLRTTETSEYCYQYRLQQYEEHHDKDDGHCIVHTHDSFSLCFPPFGAGDDSVFLHSFRAEGDKGKPDVENTLHLVKEDSPYHRIPTPGLATRNPPLP